MRKTNGFTLIELLIAIAIIAIITAIAYPSYAHYMMSSRRETAKTALLDLAGKEAKYYSVNNTFTTTLTDLGFSEETNIPVPDASSPYYTITVTNNGGAITDGFLATATPTGAQLNDECGSLTLDETGKKSYTPNGDDPGEAACW